ncbi:hypothetical protein [Coprococcus comes]|uniref:hypothetical protein n=1 Tax=Coprococcus comes TaxID=410072 RepID=UPI0023DEF09B|nr:hypothetical protein [Coprococcus comes]
MQALEQEKEYLTAEKEGLTAQIAEARADIQLLKDDKEQAVKTSLRGCFLGGSLLSSVPGVAFRTQ